MKLFHSEKTKRASVGVKIFALHLKM